MENWTDYSRFTIALFAILTPFAAIPIFLNMTQGLAAGQRSRIAGTAAVTVFGVLAVSAVSGDVVLELLGTSLASFRVGGGIVLLLMALSMLSAQVSGVQQTQEEAAEAEHRAAIGVVPIGLPLLAGPGSISAVILEMQRGGLSGPAYWIHGAIVMGCITGICLAIWVMLVLAVPIGRRLGRTGLNILNRLFGLLLAAIAIETLFAGLRVLAPGLAR